MGVCNRRQFLSLLGWSYFNRVHKAGTCAQRTFADTSAWSDKSQGSGLRGLGLVRLGQA
jgi:hypothetical protein